MSMSVYNTSFLISSVNLKKFVPESRTSSEQSEKVDRRELNFHGEEAKKAYEEIVNQESDKHSTCVKTGKFAPEKLKSMTREHERVKTRESRKYGKVTANSILKAVECGDIEYLQQNVTSLNVNVSDDYGWTPLMSAAFCGNYKIIDFLLKLGANTRCRDKSGFTAAGLASKKNYSGIVALLREKESISDIAPTRNPNPRKDPDFSQRRSRFYCSICKESFRETTVEKHEASTLHIFNSKPKLPRAMYTIPKQNKGYQMLLNRGWREEGLGPEGKGLKYPIKTLLKRDRTGLGLERKERARVTHFNREDTRAIDTVEKQPREKTLRKREREKMLSRDARRERAIRRALS